MPLGSRDVEFGARLQTFFIAAVAMVLVIRTQLWLTNYPQLGGNGLHIAHLLWGGLFMALTIGLLLVYLNRSIYQPAAVLGGVGFGFFIDELGKFITEDNDYFFRPAASLIYLIFVAIFLIIRSLEARKNLTPGEAVANAISILSGAADGDLTENEKQRALELLDRAGDETPLAVSARAMLSEVEARPAPQPGRLDRIATRIRDRYLSMVGRPWFNRTVCWLVGAWAVLTVLGTLILVLSLFTSLEIESEDIRGLSFVNWASLVSSTISAVLVLSGIRLLLAGDRVAAYSRFEKALLVAIFVTSVFSFYESQFGAVFGLGVNVLLLFTLGRMAAIERVADGRQADRVGPSPVPQAES